MGMKRSAARCTPVRRPTKFDDEGLQGEDGLLAEKELWATGFSGRNRGAQEFIETLVPLPACPQDDLGAAREKVRVARALGTLPLLTQALARGELSYAKVRALTRVATPETEARLLGVGRAGTASASPTSSGHVSRARRVPAAMWMSRSSSTICPRPLCLTG